MFTSGVGSGIGARKVNEESFSWDGVHHLGDLGDVCSSGFFSGAMFANLESVGESSSLFLGSFP